VVMIIRQVYFWIFDGETQRVGRANQILQPFVSFGVASTSSIGPAASRITTTREAYSRGVPTTGVAATWVASSISAATGIGAGASRVLNLPSGVVAFIAVEFPRPVETRPRRNFWRFRFGHWAGSGNIRLWRHGKRSRRRLRHQTVRTDRQDKQEPEKSGMCGVSFQQVFLDFRVPGRALEFGLQNKFPPGPRPEMRPMKSRWSIVYL
jgi:hypothetical protein